jgi:pantoate--beta-alanine ligase
VIIATTRAELRAARATLPGSVGVVMTMGALHSGHASLMEAARARCDSVIATIFVNPTQFGPNEDFSRYPRTLETDLEVCRAAGVDVVFTPTVEVMYPQGEPWVTVDPGSLGRCFEGSSRPGFFHGVLTVVMKLLQLTSPDLAFFGEKDYQQLKMIRIMVDELAVPVTVVGVPTVREPDGLALSSRNKYLSESERATAVALFRALTAGAEAGKRGPGAVMEAANAVFAAVPEVKLDYLALVDGQFQEVAAAGTLDGQVERAPAGSGRLLVAAWVGGTRLIDNMRVEIS